MNDFSTEICSARAVRRRRRDHERDPPREARQQLRAQLQGVREVGCERRGQAGPLLLGPGQREHYSEH